MLVFCLLLQKGTINSVYYVYRNITRFNIYYMCDIVRCSAIYPNFASHGQISTTAKIQI